MIKQIQSCRQCIQILNLPEEQFDQIEFLRALSVPSRSSQYRKSSLFIYSIYCILCKFNFVEALQAVEKSESVDEGNLMSVAVCKLIRALLYTYIDKHKQSLGLIKESIGMLQTVEMKSDVLKFHYKQMLPVIISNLNIATSKKAFYKILNEVYDLLSKESSNDPVNEEILIALQGKINELKVRIDCPQLQTSKVSQNSRKGSIGASNILKNTRSVDKTGSEYGDFRKGLSSREKSIQNIMKMAQQRRQTPNSSIVSKSKDTRSINRSRKSNFKEIQNPYELNLYVEEQPKCQFM